MVMGDMELTCEVAVIGSGPAGYAAAFRAADLGLDVALIDPRPKPGGVCLHEGCIPSKTGLHLAELIFDARAAAAMGLHFAVPRIELAEVRAWKKQVIETMAAGLAHLSSRRGIQDIAGRARFEDSTTLRIDGGEIRRIRCRQSVIATGSKPLTLPGTSFREGGRIMDSSQALALADIPNSLLVVGGGYVGLELGTLYAALGSRVQLVEAADRLLAGIDRDLVAPLQQRLDGLFENISLQTRVAAMQEEPNGVEVQLQDETGSTGRTVFDRVLVAVGRRPNTADLGLETTGVSLDERGSIVVDDRQQTADPHIFAAGDVAGGVMLAHKATREGRIAAEVIAGGNSLFDVRAIPAVVFTDPQIAWCGLTEEQAAAQQIPVAVQKFPWKFSGRAQSMGAADGLTKILVNPEDGRILGVGIVGRNAEGLIAEGVLAIEMGALAEDLALSLHPHPTLSETEAEAAEIFLGSPTHILPKKPQPR
ncbi:MAG: dihydrolipoyl dehydrogenase [Desulfobulbaceae bacterium]|nr:MAG: dihydrolipoyl dehydrogenase [Desulfobulbaceae bacterium]